MDKLRGLGELAGECRAWRGEGRTIVWTNGCFDLFHPGHLRALERAREFGDVLVVGLNSDRSVRELKGADRPILGEADRAALLSGLEAVTRVVIFDGTRCDREIRALRPGVWAKSGDYRLETLDPREREALLAGGGRIELTPLIEGMGTTLLLNKIRRGDPEKVVGAACALIRDPAGRLLLVATRYLDGIKWGLPGGGQRRGETLPETARRETREEAGLEVGIRRCLGVIERLEPAWPMHLDLHLFEAEPEEAAAYSREEFPARPRESVAGGAWFSRRRLREEPGIVLGRRLWLEYGENPDAWPPYLLMRPGEE
ncbi:MAG: adenylyltransferase/cytidyltransferase family protein [Planctomycetota bacterium]|nr:adenylyltransferase/cytidyltransferase family protein [Planctomycetota bacterium]